MRVLRALAPHLFSCSTDLTKIEAGTISMSSDADLTQFEQTANQDSEKMGWQAAIGWFERQSNLTSKLEFKV